MKSTALAASLCMLVAPVVLAQALPYEASLRFSIDPDSSDDSAITTVVAGGYRLSRETTVGVYGSYQSTDRKLPARMKTILGGGVYGEFGPDMPDFFLLPYAGTGIGFLDPSGTDGQTMVHLQGYVGARIPLPEGWFFSASATLHWADREFFDSKADNRGRVSADRTDVTFDIGLLYRF